VVIERGSSKLHCLEKLLGKRLWACRKKDYMMMMMMMMMILSGVEQMNNEGTPPSLKCPVVSKPNLRRVIKILHELLAV
jgi:hypothetical protein